MSKTPSVSIVIPSYNKREYVAASIESALAQTHACEVIVIDDGSTDGSRDIIRNYDGQITWKAEQNRGGSAARNRGVELAKGEYIQFLDADDILPNHKVARQLDRLSERGPLDIAFCPWSYFYDNGDRDALDPRKYWRDHEQGLSLLIEMWYLGGFFPPHAWLVSKQLIDKAGLWDETLTGDDDGEFFGRVLAASGAAFFCPDTEVLYRDPPDGSVSLSRSLKSARSDWAAFESVSAQILSRRDDTMAKKACLSRARKKAYAWAAFVEIQQHAATFERTIGVSDFSPSLPPFTRVVTGLFGIRTGLRMRNRNAGKLV